MGDISNSSKKTNSKNQPKQAKKSDRSLDDVTKAMIERAEKQKRLLNEIGSNYQAREIASIIARSGLYKTFEQITKNTVTNLEKSIRLNYIDKISSFNTAIVRMVRDPILNLQNNLRSVYIAPVIRLNRQFEEMYMSSATVFAESFRSAHYNSMVAFRKQIEEIARGPIEEARKIVESSYSNILWEMQKGIKRLNDYANTLPRYEAVLATNNTLVYENKSYPIPEIQSLIDETLSIYQDTLDKETFEKGINRLIKEIRKNKDPFIQRLILNFIFTLIVSILISFFNPIIDEIREHVFVNDKRTATKIIQQTITQTEIPRNVLADHRFITADVLMVRSEGKRKSKIVGKLYFGQVVLLIQKNKNWSLVEWKDSEGDLIVRGWVFTRYLLKFNN